MATGGSSWPRARAPKWYSVAPKLCHCAMGPCYRACTCTCTMPCTKAFTKDLYHVQTHLYHATPKWCVPELCYAQLNSEPVPCHFKLYLSLESFSRCQILPYKRQTPLTHLLIYFITNTLKLYSYLPLLFNQSRVCNFVALYHDALSSQYVPCSIMACNSSY